MYVCVSEGVVFCASVVCEVHTYILYICTYIILYLYINSVSISGTSAT